VVHGIAFAGLDPSLADRLGRPTAMRRGDYRWRLTLPVDGRPPADGLLPALIQWETPHHPAQRLPDVGCRLTRLRLSPPAPGPLSSLLRAIGCHHLIDLAFRESAATPSLTAEIETPEGPRHITSLPRPQPLLTK
jgi:hypothetical protein